MSACRCEVGFGSARLASMMLVALFLLACLTGLAARGLAEQSSSASSNESIGTLSVYYLPVGQGDSEFVVLPDGTTILIDAGEAWAGDYVVWYVRDVLGYNRIDYLVASHPHSDHIGGIPTVLASIEVGEVVAPEVANDTDSFWDFLIAVQGAGKYITPAEAGLVLHEASGCRVEVLAPCPDASFDDLNDASAVLKISYGETTFLFCGDATYKTVEALDAAPVDVLKVAHHGSDKSVSIPMLEDLGVSVAVIEVGWGNDYGHPSVQTLDELEYCGVQTWRTDVDGVVVARSDGRSVGVATDLGATAPLSRAEVEARAAAELGDEPEVVEQAYVGEASYDEATYDEVVSASYGPGEVVYITDTGEKYHRDGCRYLKKSKHAIGLNDAKAMGYTACKVCF